MKVFQSYNKRIKSYVKGKIVEKKDGGKYFKVLDVKEKEPKQPFKGVPIKTKRRK